MVSPALPEVPGYRILEHIGEGSFGVVYAAASDAAPERRFAIKILRADVTLRESELRRFVREGRTGRALSHPHIVPVHDFGAWQNTHYIVMDLIDGKPLTEHVPTRALTVANGRANASTARLDLRPSELLATIGALACIADALEFVHRQGFVHRDVKSSNILIRRDGHPFLADFGLSKDLNEHSSFRTSTGAIVGSPPYMSPEQITGQFARIDHRSDIYSLGITLYETACGTPPFMAESLEKLREKVLHSEAPRLRTVCASAPVGLEEVILRAIEKEPEHRYATAAELRDDLLRIAALSRERRWLAPLLLRREARRIYRRRAMWIGTALATLVVLLLAYAYNSRRERKALAARNHFDRAELALVRRELSEALREIDEAGRLVPGLAEEMLRRASAYAQFGFVYEATKALNDAKHRGYVESAAPTDGAKAELYAGLFAIGANDLAGAKTRLSRAVALDASLVDAYLLLYRVHLRLHDGDAAKATLRAFVQELKPRDPHTRFLRALIAELEGDFEGALAMLEALKTEPEASRRAWRYKSHLGRLLIRCKHQDAGEALLRQAVVENAHDSAALLNLGLARAMRGWSSDAALAELHEFARAALRLDPLLDRGLRLLVLGHKNYIEAESVLDRCANEEWVLSRRRALNVEQELANLLPVLEPSPESVPARAAVAKAWKQLEALLERAPHHLHALKLAAERAWVEQGDYARAQRLFERQVAAWERARELELRPFGDISEVWNPLLLAEAVGFAAYTGCFACCSRTDDRAVADRVIERLRELTKAGYRPDAARAVNLAEALAESRWPEHRDCVWALELVDALPSRVEPEIASIVEKVRRLCASK